MIFVTVGTQLPFDRMIQGVDDWGGAGEVEIKAQVAGGKYIADNIECVDFITAEEFVRNVNKAELIIAHAGIGAIFTARKYGVPVIVMPRKAELKEHRNNHQSATVRYFKDLSGVYVADDCEELHLLLDKKDELESCKIIDRTPTELISRLSLFIDKGL